MAQVHTSANPQRPAHAVKPGNATSGSMGLQNKLNPASKPSAFAALLDDQLASAPPESTSKTEQPGKSEAASKAAGRPADHEPAAQAQAPASKERAPEPAPPPASGAPRSDAAHDAGDSPAGKEGVQALVDQAVTSGPAKPTVRLPTASREALDGDAASGEGSESDSLDIRDAETPGSSRHDLEAQHLPLHLQTSALDGPSGTLVDASSGGAVAALAQSADGALAAGVAQPGAAASAAASPTDAWASGAHAELPHPASSDFVGALGAQLKTWMKQGVAHATLHVNPSELGPIQVRMALGAGHTQIDLQASIASTREAIQQALPQLLAQVQNATFDLHDSLDSWTREASASASGDDPRRFNQSGQAGEPHDERAQNRGEPSNESGRARSLAEQLARTLERVDAAASPAWARAQAARRDGGVDVYA